MTIARSLLPVALVAVSVASGPSSAWAQSDATCIAYMEADAAEDEAFSAALDGAREAGSKAYTAIMLPHEIVHTDAYSEATRAGSEAAEKTGRRCGGFVEDTEAGRQAMKAACAAWDTAYRATLDVHGVDDKAVEKQAERAAAKAAADFKRAAIKDARDKRQSAYRAAYGGPTSKVASVMKKLIKADRKRCRERLER